MSQESNVIIYDLMVAQEASYLAGAPLTGSTDGINVTELPEFTVNYQHSGERPQPQGTEGKQKRNPPTGRTVEGTIRSEMAGAEATYSLSVKPPLDALIEASGFSGSFESSTWIYKRNPVDESFSIAAQLFARDTVRTVSGGYCDMAWSFEEAGAVGIAEFTLMGLVSVPSTSVIPEIVHPDQEPPRVVDANITLSGSTLKVRSANFQVQRDVSTPRTDANSALGHCGFAVGRLDPILTVVVEADIGTLQAYDLRDAATEFAASLTVGDEQYNTYSWSFPTCVIMEVNEQDDGPIAMLELVLDIHNSTPAQRDDVQLTFS